MAEPFGVAIDRLLARELSGEEQRRLAQAALEDSDLFDTLTSAAVVQLALSERDLPDPETEASPTAPLHGRRRLWTLTGFAVAVAASMVMAIAYVRWQPVVRSARSEAGVVASPMTAAPVLLTARAAPTPTETFRANTTSSRFPKRNGTIVAVRDGVVDVDVGSLDGVSEDLHVQVRGPVVGAEPAQLTITTVFRERARGRVIGSGNVHVGDRVEVGAGPHVRALLEQAAAREAAQDAAAVQQLLELAVSAAESPDVPAGLRRQARTLLGTLRHRSSDLGDAERWLTLAADEVETQPVATSSERADLLNELGTVQIEQRAYSTAERTLRSAESYSAGAAKVRILNNLGAIAALGGDRAAAKSFYGSARLLARDSPRLAAERAAIEKNLSALQSGQ